MNFQYSIKRIFTLSTFTASVCDLFAHADALHAALTHQRVSQAFVKKIMLVVTQVNGCRYCSYAHTRMALQAGVSETELRELVAGEFNQLPAEEIMALTFAQHYAEQDGRFAATAWQRLEAAYGLGATGVPISILITRVSPRTARFIFTQKNSRMSHA